MYEKILNYKSQVTVTFISGGRTVLFERLMRFGVITIYFKMILIANKCKIISKGHNEVLYVLNNLLFDNFLVYILFVALANFFRVDKFQCIRIFKHHHGFARHQRVGNNNTVH